MTQPDTVTVAEAAAILGVTVDDVEALARAAKFGAWWTPGQPLLRSAVEAHRAGPGRPPAKRGVHRPDVPWASGAAAQRRADTRPPAPPAPPVVEPPAPYAYAHAHGHARTREADQRRGGRRGGGAFDNVKPGRLVEARTRALRASEERTANQDQALRQAIADRREAGASDEQIRAGLIAGGMAEDQLARYV